MKKRRRREWRKRRRRKRKWTHTVVVPTTRDNQIGISLGRGDELVERGLHRLDVLVQNTIYAATTFQNITTHWRERREKERKSLMLSEIKKGVEEKNGKESGGGKERGRDRKRDNKI